MSETKEQVVFENILTRRTIKPEQCNGQAIREEDVWKILKTANWAPTHGYTEPWRFVVFGPKEKANFCHDHAEMYKNHTAEENFKQAVYDKLKDRHQNVSHIIAYINKRGENPKIPEIEELQSTAMAVQNMQLMAHAMGYAPYIHSGGMTFGQAMKSYFNLREEDKVLGFLYLGVPNDEERAPGRRITSIEEKTDWRG